MFKCNYKWCVGHPTEKNFCTWETQHGSFPDSERNIRRELREKNFTEFEGVILQYAGEWEDLCPGDSYIAYRNTGPHLLTVREVRETAGDQNQWAGWVIPEESAYSFDLGECVKVEIIL